MKRVDVVWLFVLGMVIWVVGTIYYGFTGPAVLETTELRYWFSFFTSPVISGVICVVILRWRRIAPGDWASAMLLLAIPGMIGEAVVLTHMATFMPSLRATSGGKYGAFLFITYGMVLGVAEVVTLKARCVRLFDWPVKASSR